MTFPRCDNIIGSVIPKHTLWIDISYIYSAITTISSSNALSSSGHL